MTTEQLKQLKYGHIIRWNQCEEWSDLHVKFIRHEQKDWLTVKFLELPENNRTAHRVGDIFKTHCKYVVLREARKSPKYLL